MILRRSDGDDVITRHNRLSLIPIVMAAVSDSPAKQPMMWEFQAVVHTIMTYLASQKGAYRLGGHP